MAELFFFVEGIAWRPLEFAILLLAVLIVLYIFSRKWNLGFDKGRQAQPFLSGHLERPGMQLKAPSVYWGFFQAMKGYYSRLKKMHSHCVNDYVYWFILVLAIILVITGVS